MSKLELILNDGKMYGLHELQCRYRDHVEDMLRPLSEGMIPRGIYGLPPNALGKFFFDEVIDEMANPTLKLNETEMGFYDVLVKIKEKTCSFDKKAYDSLVGEKRERYAQKFGLELAHLVNDFMKDYKVPENCVAITDYVKLYNSWTNTPLVKDKKTGITYPLGLFRED